MKLTEVMSVGLPSRDGHLRPAASEQILAAGRARRRRVVLGPGSVATDGTADSSQERRVGSRRRC